MEDAQRKKQDRSIESSKGPGGWGIWKDKERKDGRNHKNVRKINDSRGVEMLCGK